MNEELLQFIQSLPPEQRAMAMQKAQALANQPPQMPPAPGMAPQQPPQQQPVDPRMGLPGQNKPQGIPGAFADFEGQAGVISDKQAQAQALRDTPNARGINTVHGGFVASNPLSTIATVGNRIKGGYDARKALEEKKALSDTKTKLLEDFAESKRKNQEMAKALREEPVDYNPRMGA